MPKFKFTQLALVSAVLIALASLAAAQQTAAQAPWGGWARCQINVSGQGYSDHQTHTWTISSSTSTVSGRVSRVPGDLERGGQWFGAADAGQPELDGTMGNERAEFKRSTRCVRSGLGWADVHPGKTHANASPGLR